MRIATFNINGIKARIEALLDWLDSTKPDIVLLQEIKSVDEAFPASAFEERGYNVVTHGQKSFNGVAILSKVPLEDIQLGLPGDENDLQARWVEASVSIKEESLRIIGLYAPNGNPVPGPKYVYKLAWMHRMKARVRELLAEEMPLVIAGDYNIIPQPEDAAEPSVWEQDALYLPESRALFYELLHMGLVDAYRVHHQGTGHFSFWDYQGRAWERDNGIRIDHLLLSPEAADLLSATGIDRERRGMERPSDHVPVWIELNI